MWVAKEDSPHYPWWVIFLWVDASTLHDIIEEARPHLKGKNELELHQRGIYRYSHLHPWSWKLPLLVTGVFVFLFVVLAAVLLLRRNG